MTQPIDWKKRAKAYGDIDRFTLAGFHDLEVELVLKSQEQAFLAGVRAALEEAAKVHDNIDPACSHEVALGAPGAAGIRVAIQYRNLIRALIPDVSQPGDEPKEKSHAV